MGPVLGVNLVMGRGSHHCPTWSIPDEVTAGAVKSLLTHVHMKSLWHCGKIFFISTKLLNSAVHYKYDQDLSSLTVYFGELTILLHVKSVPRMHEWLLKCGISILQDIVVIAVSFGIWTNGDNEQDFFIYFYRKANKKGICSVAHVRYTIQLFCQTSRIKMGDWLSHFAVSRANIIKFEKKG